VIGSLLCRVFGHSRHLYTDGPTRERNEFRVHCRRCSALLLSRKALALNLSDQLTIVVNLDTSNAELDILKLKNALDDLERKRRLIGMPPS
jgi:hypothetical protein